MSGKSSSEDLKRICLICGCHTNQTINIYEPRSGPNIIELIQAKFKFQPINEDKYLCFSCNNWLINWHSLQCVNSNEEESAESSSSGNFRNQLNNGGASISKERMLKMKKRNGFYFSKRSRKRSVVRAPCKLCGTSAVFLGRKVAEEKPLHCNKCQRILKWRSEYLKTLLTESKTDEDVEEVVEEQPSPPSTPAPQEEKTPEPQNPPTNNNLVSSYTYVRYQRPLIDGKVVSMLRRCGTTLTREKEDNQKPQIMSPRKKQKQVWTRQVDENEIVIDFNLAITEVLGSLDQLSSDAEETDNDSGIDGDFDNTEDAINIDEIRRKLPKGLSVSVTSA
ncbi:hypothetical protein ACFFRR_007535 [Megaselia abdita]